jgi:hypothetical protein
VGGTGGGSVMIFVGGLILGGVLGFGCGVVFAALVAS